MLGWSEEFLQLSKCCVTVYNLSLQESQLRNLTELNQTAVFDYAARSMATQQVAIVFVFYVVV